MAAWGYEFYLLMLKVSLMSERSEKDSERYFQHSKIKFIYPHGHVISSIYHFDGLVYGFVPGIFLRVKLYFSETAKARKNTRYKIHVMHYYLTFARQFLQFHQLKAL